MRQVLILLLLGWAGVVPLACGEDAIGPPPQDDMASDAGRDQVSDPQDRAESDGPIETVVMETDAVTLVVMVSPFSFQLINPANEVVLGTQPYHVEVSDEGYENAYGPPAAALGTTSSQGNDHPAEDSPGSPSTWISFDNTQSASVDDEGVHLTLVSSQDAQAQIEITLAVNENRLHVEMSLDSTGSRSFNRLAQTFLLAPDEHLFGLGASPDGIDRRGRSYATWVEHVPAAETAPEGVASTSRYPVPFLLSTAGYGFWADLAEHALFEMGSVAADYWRFEVSSTGMTYDVFVNTDPMRSLRNLTGIIGRASMPADWVFGTRWRTQPAQETLPGQAEWELVREQGIAMTIIDDGLAFLPEGAERGQEADLTAQVSLLHQAGFKVIGLTMPQLSADAEAVREDYENGVNWGYFVRNPEGRPYLVHLDGDFDQEVATIDLTRDVAARWYQSLMERALALGYDGWLLDLRWTVPEDAVFHSGQEAPRVHNLFPRLAQQSAQSLLERSRTGDYLLAAREGYTSSHTLLSLVVNDDIDPCLDRADGLSSAVRVGVNLGLSGVPYYGAFVTCQSAFPGCIVDRESLVRWVQFSALTPAMTLSDVPLASMTRFVEREIQSGSVFTNQDILDLFKRYSLLHTRLAPYLMGLSLQAAATGAPLMRHPYLVFPQDSQTPDLDDQYFLGGALMVAPVLGEGIRGRNVYFPDGYFVHWDTGQVVQGPVWERIIAPLDSIPLFIADGGIVPLLDAAIETLAVEERFDVVGYSDVAGVLDVRAVRSPGSANFTMADGTILSLEVTGEVQPPFSVNDVQLTRALSIEDVTRCESGCYFLTTQTPAILYLSTPQGENLVVQGTGIALLAENPSAHPRRIRWEVVLPTTVTLEPPEDS